MAVKVKEPGDFPSPPDDVDELEDWMRDYLSPEEDGQGYQAHKFICNVLTYPFVRDLHFAATPNRLSTSGGCTQIADSSPSRFSACLKNAAFDTWFRQFGTAG